MLFEYNLNWLLLKFDLSQNTPNSCPANGTDSCDQYEYYETRVTLVSLVINDYHNCS